MPEAYLSRLKTFLSTACEEENVMSTALESPARNRRLGSGTIAQVVGLACAGLGVLLLFLSGLPGFPKVPPGPIIMIGFAVLIFVVRRWWMALVGLVATVGISAGFVATMAGAIDRLSDPTRIGYFIGTIGQLGGLLVALVGGVVAVVGMLRARRAS